MIRWIAVVLFTALAGGIALSFVFPPWSLPIAVGAILAGGCAALLLRYRSDSPLLSGAPVIIIVGMVAIYVVGAIPREMPVFGLNPPPDHWALYIAGFAMLVVGMWLGAVLPHRPARRGTPPSRRGSKPVGLREWLLYIGVVGALVLSVINFSTGDIPLFMSDVNDSRFSGNFGVLGRLWPLILPTLQAAVVIAASRVLSGRWDVSWIALAGASMVVLVLSGGRSLFLLPLIAVGIMVLDLKRPPLWILGGGAAALLTVFAAIGYFRSLGDGADAESFRQERGLEGWWGALDISLQAGPRVMASALDVLDGASLHGQILVGDILNFVNSQFTRSDRIVTELLDRDVDQVGGLPPTIWGGFMIDFGIAGVALGGLVIGILLGYSRVIFLERRTLGAGLWYSYFAAYVLISAYSYISIRPSWLVVVGIAIIASGGFSGGSAEDSDGLEVPRSARRR